MPWYHDSRSPLQLHPSAYPSDLNSSLCQTPFCCGEDSTGALHDMRSAVFSACRWALLLQAELVTDLFQVSLVTLDTLSFSLPIEVPTKTPAAVAAGALLSSAGSLFRRQQSHYQASTSQPDSKPAQGSSTGSHQGVANNRHFNASAKRWVHVYLGTPLFQVNCTLPCLDRPICKVTVLLASSPLA